MNPLRKIGGLLLIAGSALAGHWIGTKLRATTTGAPEQSLGLLHITPDGQTVLGLNIPLTNFVPDSTRDTVAEETCARRATS